MSEYGYSISMAIIQRFSPHEKAYSCRDSWPLRRLLLFGLESIPQSSGTCNHIVWSPDLLDVIDKFVSNSLKVLTSRDVDD